MIHKNLFEKMPYEVEHSLDRICEQDSRTMGSFTVTELLDETNYQIGLYLESGTAQSESLSGDCGKESQRIARRELAELRAYWRLCKKTKNDLLKAAGYTEDEINLLKTKD